MSHEKNELYAEGEVDDDIHEEQSVETSHEEQPDTQVIAGDRHITVEKLSFGVEDDIPTANIQGVEIKGLFEPSKNPLVALLANFADTTDD